MANKVYPDWVQAYRTKGTSIRKVGNNYYLYQHSSKRVVGKKNPVPNDTYIGRITPEGIVKGEKKKVLTDNSNITVKEFGFSRSLEILCPMGWKNPLGEHWQAVLDKVIVSESPESYVSDVRHLAEELDPHIQFGAQKASLVRRLKNEHGIELRELYPLKTIYLVTISGKKVISRISDRQAELLQKIRVNLEVD